jgi:hypothetical protein
MLSGNQRAEHAVSTDKVCTIVKTINRDSVGTRGQNMSQLTKSVPKLRLCTEIEWEPEGRTCCLK